MPDTNTLQALVTAEHRHSYRVNLNGKDLTAQITGKFLGQTAGKLDFPTVGDYVAITLHDNGEKAVIHEVMPRKSILMRKEVFNGHDAQPVAANIDRVFIVMGLDGNYNLARLERLLVAAWDSNAVPSVVFTKSDLCAPLELQEKLSAAAQAAPGVAVFCVCGTTGEGVDVVARVLTNGITCCFVGSSGAGKSTLLNRLCGREAAATAAVRENDSRGRHTTVARQLYILPGGGRVIDTPGVREFCLGYAETGLDTSFPDVDALTLQCRFTNCTHETEPGCAVRAAVERGELPPERLKNYRKVQKEMLHAASKHDTQSQQLVKRKLKTLGKLCRGITVEKRKLRGG